jgi:hypothetical protein
MVQGGQVDHGEPQTWLASERAKRPGLEALLPPSAEEEELISTAFSALEDDPTGVIDYYGAIPQLLAPVWTPLSDAPSPSVLPFLSQPLRHGLRQV